jgi:hypothetical protein
MDHHSRVYTDAHPGDHVTDRQMQMMIRGGELTIHDPDCDLNDDPIRTPESHEDDRWDSGQETTKTVAEAGMELRARQAHGGDKDADPCAYDNVEKD